MKTFTKSFFIILLTFLAVAIFLSQLQPFIVKAAGAVDGTFGVRPISHNCLGLTLNAGENTFWPPPGDIKFHLWLFQFQYDINEKHKFEQRSVCVGQDLWYGE